MPPPLFHDPQDGPVAQPQALPVNTQKRAPIRLVDARLGEAFDAEFLGERQDGLGFNIEGTEIVIPFEDFDAGLIQLEDLPAATDAAPEVVVPTGPEPVPVHSGFEKPHVGSGSAPMGSVAPGPVSQQAVGAAPIPAPSMGDPLGIMPAPAPTAPAAGPLTAAVKQLAPAPLVPPTPEPKFPDQKPGVAIRLAGTDGIVSDGAFLRETPEGQAVVRVDGEEHTLSPVDFDRARTEATRIDEAAKAAAKAGTKPKPKAAELPAPSVAPEGTTNAEQPDPLRPDADPAGRGAAASPAETDNAPGIAGDNQGVESGAAVAGGGIAPAEPAAGNGPGDAPGLADNADAGDLDVPVAPQEPQENGTQPSSAAQIKPAAHSSPESKVFTPTIEPIRAKAAVLRGVPKETPPDVPGVSLKWDDKAGGFIFSRKHTDKVQAAVSDRKPLTVEAQDGAVAAAAADAAPEPTEGQKEAGNYRKGHARWQGLDLTIENAKGSERRGVDRGGKPWSITMPAHYGYFRKTEGADGDHVDFYMGPNEASENAWIIDQVDAETGAFDEHKLMLGFDSAADARAAHEAAFSDGKGADRRGGIKKMSVGELKDWLASGDTKSPVSAKFRKQTQAAAKRKQQGA